MSSLTYLQSVFITACKIYLKSRIEIGIMLIPSNDFLSHFKTMWIDNKRKKLNSKKQIPPSLQHIISYCKFFRQCPCNKVPLVVQYHTKDYTCMESVHLFCLLSSNPCISWWPWKPAYFMYNWSLFTNTLLYTFHGFLSGSFLVDVYMLLGIKLRVTSC